MGRPYKFTVNPVILIRCDFVKARVDHRLRNHHGSTHMNLRDVAVVIMEAVACAHFGHGHLVEVGELLFVLTFACAHLSVLLLLSNFYNFFISRSLPNGYFVYLAYSHQFKQSIT